MPTDASKYFYIFSFGILTDFFDAPFESQVNVDSELRNDLLQATIG